MSMPTEISAEVVARVLGGERVVVPSDKGQLVVLGASDYDRLKSLEEQDSEARVRMMQLIRGIQEESARNGVSELSDEEVEAEIAAARRERRERQSRG